MSFKPLIDLGAGADTGTGDSPRSGGAKINYLMADIYNQLGDNPLDFDQTSPYYGTRSLIINDSLVGDLHPSGYWHKVTALSPGQLRSIDNSDGNTFYASPGEQLIIDFSELNTSESFNLILPLANKGDVIKIRDAYNTLIDSKILKVWTTPLEYTGTGTWLYGERVLENPGALPSNNHTKINGNNYSYTAVSSVGNTAISLAPDGLNFTDKGLTIEFVYSGDNIGWTYYLFQRESPRTQIGQLIFESPVFSASKRPAESTVETIYFNPNMDDGPLQQRNNPIVSGTRSYIEGDVRAANTIQINELWLANQGNGLILKGVSDVATYQAANSWRIEFSYPQTINNQDLLYKGKVITIINESGLPIVLAPLIWNPDGTKNPGKDGNVNNTLLNYYWITQSYNVSDDFALVDLGVTLDSNVKRADLVFTDSIAYNNGKTLGWSIVNIEYTETGIGAGLEVLDGGTY